MSDFELDIELSISLVESRIILWDKKAIFIKKGMKQKLLRKECVLVLKKILKHQ